MKVHNTTVYPAYTAEGQIGGGERGDVNSRTPRNAKLIARGILKPIHQRTAPKSAPVMEAPADSEEES